MQSSFSYRGDLSFHNPKQEEDSDEDPMVLGMSSEGYQTNGHDNEGYELNGRAGSSSGVVSKKSAPANGKKTKGRVKIKMEFIDNKLRRYTTFSKRKTGIMKKAYELSTLTGTQVMLLVASETGHVYTFATRKLQPMITSEAGKALIQTCLNSPDLPPGPGALDQRMSATGFEETDLTYSVADECEKMSDSPDNIYTSELSPSSLTPTPTMFSSSMVSFASSLSTTTATSQQRPMGSKSSFTPSSSPVSTPTNLTSPNTSLANGAFTTILTSGATKNQTSIASDSSSSHNSISVVQSSSPNLSVVSGSVVLPQTILQANNSAVLYHTGQGLVYATPANLPEGVVLNLGQEQGGSQQQYITIPVSLSLSPAQQQLVQGTQVSSPSSTFTTVSSRREKTRK